MNDATLSRVSGHLNALIAEAAEFRLVEDSCTSRCGEGWVTQDLSHVDFYGEVTVRCSKDEFLARETDDHPSRLPLDTDFGTQIAVIRRVEIVGDLLDVTAEIEEPRF